MKINSKEFYNTEVMGITTWSKINGITSAINWASIFTYTTGATTDITAWIGASVTTNVTIPDIINGASVTVAPSTTFRANAVVTSVNINSTVSFVGDSMVNAFNACYGLTSVNAIPDSVTGMGYAFIFCNNLVTAPTIGANVTNMSAAFYNCTNLINAPTIGANVTNMAFAFAYCNKLVNTTTLPNSISNMEFTFQNCTNLIDSPDIPSNVVNMAGTFGYCTSLVNVPTIPDAVTNTASLFSYCSSLVTAPMIGVNTTNMRSTFYACNHLVGDITITSPEVANFTTCFFGSNASLAKIVYVQPGSNTYNLAVNTINGANGVTVRTFDEIFTYTTGATTNVTAWIGSAISNKVAIPNIINGAAVVINSPTFRYKTTLAYVNIASNVSFVSNNAYGAFMGDTNLINVDTIPNSVTSTEQMFYQCTNLINAPIIGSSVASLNYAFAYCSKLVSMTNIPNSVNNMIGTFISCVNLIGNIFIESSNVSNFTTCFTGCNASKAKTVYVPAGSNTYNLAVNTIDGKNGVTVVGR